MTIDPRLRERRKTVAEDHAKRNVGRLLRFLTLVLVVGGGVWVIFSPWLSVSRVTTSGIEMSAANSTLTDHRVVAGTPMILLNPSQIQRALLDDPWVAEATVQRLWPDDVVVDVVERTPEAWAHTAGGWTRRAVDGVALPSEPEPDGKMARIDMPGIADSEATSSVDLLGALEFVAALPAEHEEGTVITRSGGEIWATVGGFQVRLGRAVDMTEKALSLEALLKENPSEGSTLVLIAPTNPAATNPDNDGDQSDNSSDSSDDEGETGSDGSEEQP